MAFSNTRNKGTPEIVAPQGANSSGGSFFTNKLTPI